MADPPDSNGDPRDEGGVGPEREPINGTPRWVTVFGIIAIVASLLFLILMFTRGPGGHTPFRHLGRPASPEDHPR